jgi:hypothetical protein
MNDEKLEVWFESIESQLNEIRKKQSLEYSEEVHKKTQGLFDDFIIKIRGIKLNLPPQDFSQINQKIDSVLLEAKRSSQPMPMTHVKTEHYFLFFPDLKNWFYLLKRAKFIWLLTVILSGSLYFNWHFYKDHDRFETSDLKLRYMRYQGSIPLVSILTEIDSSWSEPKFRSDAINFIKSYESTILQEKEKQNRITEMEKQLKTLKATE